MRQLYPAAPAAKFQTIDPPRQVDDVKRHKTPGAIVLLSHHTTQTHSIFTQSNQRNEIRLPNLLRRSVAYSSTGRSRRRTRDTMPRKI